MSRDPLPAPKTCPGWLAGTPALALILVLAGCSTPAPAPAPLPPAPTSKPPAPDARPAPPRPAAAPPAPAVVPPLVAEQRWLDEWFRGTPVQIALADASTLNVDVPLANSFDSGSDAIKPALAAVLDRIATSLRRQPGLRLTLAAPADAGGPATLAAARTQRLREHLVGRGVAAARIGAAAPARAGSGVALRMLTVAQPISRLDESAPPASAPRR